MASAHQGLQGNIFVNWTAFWSSPGGLQGSLKPNLFQHRLGSSGPLKASRIDTRRQNIQRHAGLLRRPCAQVIPSISRSAVEPVS